MLSIKLVLNLVKSQLIHLSKSQKKEKEKGFWWSIRLRRRVNRALTLATFTKLPYSSRNWKIQKSIQDASCSKCRSVIWSHTGHQWSLTRAKSITNSQCHSNLRGIDWRASKCTCTSVAFLLVLPAPSRGVLRQPLQHPLCGRHLTFSLCLSYHSAATTSEHARNANDIKILSRKQPHIQTPQYVKALLLSASETTVVIACKLQTMCTWCWEYMKAVRKSRYRAIITVSVVKQSSA